MVVSAERHLLVRVERLGEDVERLTASQLSTALRASYGALFGDAGLGCVSGLAARHYCAPAGFALVRVPRRHAAQARAAATAVQFIRKRPVRLSVIHMAGSQRTARRALVRRLEQQLAALAPPRPRAALGLCEGAAVRPPAVDAAATAAEIRRSIRELKDD